MKRIISYTLITAAIVSLTACEKFLSRETYDQVSSEEFWKSETDLELYANGFIQKMIPSASDITRGDISSDICAVALPGDLVRPDGNISPDNQGGWSENSWTDLRRVNYMLDNMPRCRGKVSDEIYRHYEGVARFWRAWFYYGKIRTFGAVPWYDYTIQASDYTSLMKPRDSREFVMDKVLEDLTFAAENCLADSKYTQGSALINKWTALAFKSRVCLYEGTFRKYHPRDPSFDKPWDNATYNVNNKFLNEAADAAKEIMDKGPFSLVTGNVTTDYRSLFTSAALNTQEVIFGREFSKDLSAFHDTSWWYYSSTYGSKVSMTKQFMNTYLTTSGTPFTSTAGYKTVDFINEFTGRDARMRQTVINPEYKMTLSGRADLYCPNWKVTRTGYHPIKWSIDNDSDRVLTTTASWNSLPIIRYAEVLLNYAEAKAELGEMDASVWAQTMTPLRNRAGVTSVVPTQADPYMEEYFLNTISDMWILEVRRERGIEMCLEMGIRWDDVMRWHMGDLLASDNKPWKGIYIGSTSYSYDYTHNSTDDFGNTVPDFYIKPGEDTEHSIAISNTGRNQTFSLDADGNIVWEYRRVWAEKKYLRPIPQSAITRNPNLEQNAYWK
jgi:hypothetical protein